MAGIREKITLCGVIDTQSIPRGHISHHKGAGIHKDKRTKRGRTRAANLQRVLNDA